MERQLNLIKSQERERENRIFPRYPFSSLTFKANKYQNHVFQVVDISLKGMQVCLKNGDHSYRENEEIEGELHWHGDAVAVHGKVKWVNAQRMGVSFANRDKLMQEFLHWQQFVQGLRPLHEAQFEMDLPAHLKIWLRSDGPLEIFIWQHPDGEFSRFQIIFLRHFVEWEDAKGPKTGEVIEHKDTETPLSSIDELTIEFDPTPSLERCKLAVNIISNIPQQLLNPETARFLQLKLGN